MSKNLRETPIPDEIRSSEAVQSAARDAALKYLQKIELEKTMYRKYKDTPGISKNARDDVEAAKRMVIYNGEGVVKVVEPSAEDLRKMNLAYDGVTGAMDYLRKEVAREAEKLGIVDSTKINEIANALEFQARPRRESALSK